MSQPRDYRFGDQLRMSHGIANDDAIPPILLQNIPGALQVLHADQQDDRNGTDWWVLMTAAHRVSVDAKVRPEDFSRKISMGMPDDLALETWSVIERNKIGWTRDRTKRTDYILWLWLDTRRWCLVPFQMLCAVFEQRWQEWREKYRPWTQSSNGGAWHSECIFVPRKVVWAAIYQMFGGRPGA